MLNKKLAKKWIKALRSGKYKQTYGVLNDKNGFCCLGVLCDITKSIYDIKTSDGYIAGSTLDSQNKAHLLGDSTDLICGDGLQISLPDLNDNGQVIMSDNTGMVMFAEHLSRFSFDEIADIIQIEILEGLK